MTLGPQAEAETVNGDAEAHAEAEADGGCVSALEWYGDTEAKERAGPTCQYCVLRDQLAVHDEVGGDDLPQEVRPPVLVEVLPADKHDLLLRAP